MSLPNIQFFYQSGAPFALVHESNAAFALWKERRWPFSINGGQKFEADDWHGREAMEKIFGVSYAL